MDELTITVNINTGECRVTGECPTAIAEMVTMLARLLSGTAQMHADNVKIAQELKFYKTQEDLHR